MSDIKAEIAAYMLQNYICAAICENDQVAIDWLLLDGNVGEEVDKNTHSLRSLSNDEILTPPETGFIATCRLLGLDWQWLRITLKNAISPGPLANDSGSVKYLPRIVIVQAPEPCYNSYYDSPKYTGQRPCNEADYDSDRARQTPESEH